MTSRNLVPLCLVAIFLFALALRLVWVSAVESVPVPDNDTQYYHETAQSLARGDGYAGEAGSPSAWRVPGYSAYLAGFYLTFGADVETARLANAIMSSLIVLPVFAIGLYFFSARIGLIAALIVAAMPSMIFWTSSLMPESLASFLFLTALALMLWSRRQSNENRTQIDLRFLAAAGVFIGLSALVRNQSVALIPVGLLWLASPYVRALGWRTAGVLVIPPLLILGAWVGRNLSEVEQPVLALSSGYNFHIGHAPFSNGSYVEPRELRADAPPPGIEREVFYNREGFSRGLDYALSHPVQEVELSVRKLLHLWRPDFSALSQAESDGATPIGTGRGVLNLALHGYHFLFGFAVVGGLVLYRGHGEVVIIGALLIVLWSLGHVVFFATPRLAIPLLPALAPLAAAAVAAAASYVTARYVRPVQAA